MKNSNLILKLYSITLTFILGFFVISGFKANEIEKEFDEITVKRINIVDEKGINKMVLSNKERMEPPIISGKKHKRALSPAGIIFYNEKGDECGGIALSKNPKTSTYAIVFDYDNADAIGIISQQNSIEDSYKSGLIINDKDITGKVGNNINRINLMTTNGNSGLVINGPDEKPRIIIAVDSLGNPLFKMMDGEGKVIQEY